MHRTGFEHSSKQEEWKFMEWKQLMLERAGIVMGRKFLRAWGLKHTYAAYKYISELWLLPSRIVLWKIAISLVWRYSVMVYIKTCHRSAVGTLWEVISHIDMLQNQKSTDKQHWWTGKYCEKIVVKCANREISG